MKNVFLATVVATALLPTPSPADSASQADIESAWLAFLNTKGEPSLIRGDVTHSSANNVFRIIPPFDPDTINEDKRQLGSELFSERKLSRDGTVACASCHVVVMGGADRRPIPFGIDGAQGTLNAPTVFNAALNFRQFWDGRALTLQEQSLGPIENPAEFDHDIDSALGAIKSIPDYVRAFDELYPDGITAANLGDAIAYYETINFTGLGSPFLRQFEEEGEPLSPQAIRGQQRFVEVGCTSCHNGVNLGGNSYQQLGVAASWYGEERAADEHDDGLFGRTGREQDRHVFKVPTLHNVAFTGPWLHDGSITSLQQAVDQMARHQLGRYLENSDIDDIVTFLRALGDSLGMMGNCTASGSYSISMDCSMNEPTASAGRGDETTVPSTTLLDPATMSQRHQKEYDAALNRLTQAEDRIRVEMQRIQSGVVAHYDFLQYEHIEMLRHARALSYPPANLSLQQRDALRTKATKWQQLAEDYEFIISDFLRDHAVASSAKTNYQDLLRILSVAADEKTLSLLAQAETQMLEFYAKPSPQTKLNLENVTRTLLDSDLNPERLAELNLQLSLLLNGDRPRFSVTF